MKIKTRKIKEFVFFFFSQLLKLTEEQASTEKAKCDTFFNAMGTAF